MAIGILAGATFLVGCGESDTTSDARSASSTAPPKTGSSIQPGDATPAPTAPVDLAGWQEVEITDTTGATFTIGDLVGRPVLVENFATWCSNCRQQLGDTQKAAAAAGEAAVFVALSVETDVDTDDVRAYAQKNGFSNIRFAVMSPDMLGAMYDSFGNSALNPPSTPHIAVSAQGLPGELVTGFESPGQILASLGIG